MKCNNVLDQGQGLQRSVEFEVDDDNDGFVLVDDEAAVAVEALEV